MFEPFDSTKYYESENQRKVLYIPNLSMLLNAVNLQVLKLPHEISPESENQRTGTTYADIVQSIINGVKMIYAVIQPLRIKYETEYDKPNPKTIDEALAMYGWIYELLDYADYLNDTMVEVVLPDEEEEDEVEELGEDDRFMPAHKQTTDDKTVGAVEEENKKPVAKKNMASSI